MGSAHTLEKNLREDCIAEAAHRPDAAGCKQISVAIIDTNRLFRDGLRYLLRKPRFAIVATGQTFAEAFAVPAVTAKVDLVICGLDADRGVGAQLAAIQERFGDVPRPRIVLLTEVVKLSRLREALESGVDALLSKDISGEVLQRSIELVMLGQQLFPASLARSLVEASEAVSSVPPASPPTSPPTREESSSVIRLEQHKAERRLELMPGHGDHKRSVILSERESQILRCLINGSPNKAIARVLGIAEATVKVHVKGLLRKVGVHNRTQAAIWALNNSLEVGPAPGFAPDLAVVGAPRQRAST